MSKNNYTTNKRKFKHLTREKRAQIEILLKQGTSKIKIAKEIDISRSTLYNEIKRGTIWCKYNRAWFFAKEEWQPIRCSRIFA